MYPTSHEHHLSLHKNSQLNDVKPQHKVLGCFLIVLSVAFSDVQNIFQILSHIVIVMYILYLSKIPLKTYLKRLTLDIPFILFALFLPFLSSENNDKVFEIFSLNIYQTGLNDMLTILFKATLGLTIGIVLTAVTSSMEIIYGLQKLKVPNILIAIMSFTIRYIDVFIDEFKRVRISMKSRGYLEKGLKSLIPIAFASGAMLIRGYERGERVYLSMISRGFQGTIEFKSRSYKTSYKFSLCVVSSLVILGIDKLL